MTAAANSPADGSLAAAARAVFGGGPPAWEPGPPDHDRWRAVVASGMCSQDALSDLATVCVELGRSAALLPVHNAVVLTEAVLAAVGAPPRLTESVRQGTRFATCLVEPSGADIDVRAVIDRAGEGWRVDGACGFVPGASDADTLLVVATEAAGVGGCDVVVLAVDPGAAGVVVTPLDSIGGDRQCHVAFEAVALGTAAVVAGPLPWARLQPALDRAVVAHCADMVGAAEALLDHTVEQVTARHQWGVPLGSLQAVQHRCADMLLDVTLAREAVFDAASSIDRGEDSRYHAAMAKAFCADACRRVSASVHQLCGGEGIYADQPVHVWYRRIKSFEAMLGSPRDHRRVVAEHVLDSPG